MTTSAWSKLLVLMEMVKTQMKWAYTGEKQYDIFYEKDGCLCQSGSRFHDRKRLEGVIQKIAAGVNRVIGNYLDFSICVADNEFDF